MKRAACFCGLFVNDHLHFYFLYIDKEDVERARQAIRDRVDYSDLKRNEMEQELREVLGFELQVPMTRTTMSKSAGHRKVLFITCSITGEKPHVWLCMVYITKRRPCLWLYIVYITENPMCMATYEPLNALWYHIYFNYTGG